MTHILQRAARAPRHAAKRPFLLPSARAPHRPAPHARTQVRSHYWPSSISARTASGSRSAASKATRSISSTPGARRCASAPASTTRAGSSPPAMKAALACLARFRERLSGLHPAAVRVVATNTFRVAKNAREFLALRRAHARLSDRRHQRPRGRRGSRSSASRTSCRRRSRPRLVIDIGGGSTEFIIGRGLEPERLESLTIGCVGMTQRFFRDGTITAAGARRGGNRGARRDRGDRAARSARRTGARPTARPAPRWRSPTSSSRTLFRAAASRRRASRGCAGTCSTPATSRG